ncbi:MAG: hypothetical protein ACLFVJ_14125 [Persicimonas sp.]
MKRTKSFVWFTVCLLLLATTFGCERKPEDLEEWRNAKGGMDKMEEWASSPDEPKDVRIRAVQILVEEGHSNALQPIFDDIEDDQIRTDLIAGALPLVIEKWEAQDIPELDDEIKEQGGTMQAGASESVLAKDAAYFLLPHARGETKEKLESILAEWMSKDWQLRNQLGRTTLAQVAPRAGKAGMESLVLWTAEAVQPHQPVEIVNEHGDDEAKEKVAKALVERAKEEHPELDDSMQTAIFTLEHKAVVPYLEKAASDPDAPPTLIDRSMNALVRVQGERATPFFADLVKNRQGTLRWVAATRIVEVMQKPAFLNVATGLPVEMDSYPPVDEDGLKSETAYFCNMYHGEMEDNEISSVSDQLTRGLESNRWPARVLALRCAQVFKAKDLTEKIEALKNDSQKIPGWGEAKTIGQLADETLEALTKA